MSVFHFPTYFSALNHGRTPFHWQQLLYDKFLDGEIPALIDLPTGTGKTSVMSIWLLALAGRQQMKSPGHFPRRLVWVVDRRVVVDQVEAEAVRIAKALTDPDNNELTEILRSISVSGADLNEPVIATSTLRGEHEDNRAWRNDPSRPAVIAGTVDMIGSRLLFSGYGVSWKMRSIHAALLAQDTLIVNDEAHLTPAFAALIEQIAEQSGSHRALRTIRMSATPNADSPESFPANLAADLAHPLFAQRVNAPKHLELSEVADHNKEIERLALIPAGRTAVFVRSPKQARKIANVLSKEFEDSVVVITGEMRGLERNQILQNPIIKRLGTPENGDETPCWIVATSAAEVGMDFSVQRLITDLDSADHLIQRFGRLNRFGATQGNAIVVGAAKQRKDDKRFEATWNYLHTLNGDVSPQQLRDLPPDSNETMGTPPPFPPLLPWQIDVWSMTSIRQLDWPDRPQVEPWLRGAEEKTAPETYVAWRDETADLTNSAVPLSDVQQALDAFPIQSHEKLKQYTYELLTALEEYPDVPAVLQLADGEVIPGTIRDLLGKHRNEFAYSTLILPTYVGVLDKHGMVEWAPLAKSKEDVKNRDVANTGKREKRKVNGDERDTHLDFKQRFRLKIYGFADPETVQHSWYFWTAKPDHPANDKSEELATHLADTEQVAKQLADRLNLAGIDPVLPQIIAWSAANHDLGKNRKIWQKVFGDEDRPEIIVAKSDKSYVNGRALAGFRHELASVIDAGPHLPADWTIEQQDLALHLIASHHGFARPHFPEKAVDRENVGKSQRIALETAQRFSRLHRQWGPWTLAYLESVLRAADAIASRGLEDKTP